MLMATKEEKAGDEEKTSTTLEAGEEGLASLRKIIEALDNFEARWKVPSNYFEEAYSK